MRVGQGMGTLLSPQRLFHGIGPTPPSYHGELIHNYLLIKPLRLWSYTQPLSTRTISSSKAAARKHNDGDKTNIKPAVNAVNAALALCTLP